MSQFYVIITEFEINVRGSSEESGMFTEFVCNQLLILTRRLWLWVCRPQ